MRRSVSAASLVVAASVLASCFNDRSPTGPVGVDARTLNATINADGCVDGSPLLGPTGVDETVKFLIVNLYEGNHESSALTMWENLKKDKLDGRPLQNHINNIAGWTLDKLAAGSVVDPDGTSGLLNATTGSIQLLDLVFDCAGATPTTIPTPPPGFDAAWQLVSPSTNNQQFNTNVGDAGVFLPGSDGGALEDNTLLVIVKQPPEVQVNTPFPKLTNTVDVALAGGKLKPGRKMSVLFCPVDELIAPSVNRRAVVAHQKDAAPPGSPPGFGVEYLPPPEGGNLDCDNLNVASWQNEKGFLRQRAAQLAWYAKKALKVVSPKPAYAIHAAIGGSSPKGSPMVGSDPYLVTNIEITSVTPNPATYGQTVDVTARLHIADVDANPAPYRNTYVNPDVAYTLLNGGVPVVNKTQTRGTNLPMAASVDGGARTAAVTDDVNSAASWAFPCLNAGGHTVQVDFAETYVTAFAPVYGASTASAPFTVNPYTLTIQAANLTRIYGDNTPALGGTLGTVPSCDAGRVRDFYEAWEDEARTTPVSGSTTVGPYTIFPRVTFDAPALASNYNVVPTNATLTVIPRPINFTVYQPATRQYGEPNGSALIAISPLSGYDGTQIRNGDVLTFDWNVPSAVATTPAGTSHPIVVAFTGARIGNYAVTLVPANPVMTITPRILTGAANPGTKVYGDANPTFTGTLNNTTLCCGAADGLTWQWVSDATATTDAGTYGPATANAIHVVLGGGPEANYDASAVARGVLTIDKRQLTGSIDSKNKTVGEANPALTGTVNNLVSDSYVTAFSTTATDASPAGSYPITLDLSGTGGGNYLWTGSNGTLLVSDATLQQQQLQMDLTVGNSALGGGPQSQQKLAQTVTPAITGSLTEVAFPILCSNGTVIVEIQGVAADGRPNGTVLATQSVAAADLPPVNPAVFRTITFATPANVTSGTPFAIVLRMSDPDTESCGVVRSPVGDLYAGGDSFFDARPNTPGVWVGIGARKDFPFKTVVVAAP